MELRIECPKPIDRLREDPTGSEEVLQAMDRSLLGLFETRLSGIPKSSGYHYVPY